MILGPSGAGKTTTLKSIAGLVDVDAGSVDIGGTDMTLVEPYHRNVAMAFESYALYPQKTVSENLASPLKSGPDRQVLGAAAHRAHRPGHHHAGNQPAAQAFSPRAVQRAAAARRARPGAGAARGRLPARRATEPSRRQAAAAMRAELKQLGAMSNTTTIYVTHDYQEALALGDRIAVMREGTAGADRHTGGDLAQARGHVRRPLARSARDQHPRRRGRRRPDPPRGRLAGRRDPGGRRRRQR